MGNAIACNDDDTHSMVLCERSRGWQNLWPNYCLSKATHINTRVNSSTLCGFILCVPQRGQRRRL